MQRMLLIACMFVLLWGSQVAADDHRKDRFCSDVLDTIEEQIFEFEGKRRSSDRDKQDFIRDLREQLEPGERICPGVSLLLNDMRSFDVATSRRDDSKIGKDRNIRRNKRSGANIPGRKDHFCEDVVEDIQDALSDFEGDVGRSSWHRGTYIQYVLQDLDPRERHCARLVFDDDKDVSPHMRHDIWNGEQYTLRFSG